MFNVYPGCGCHGMPDHGAFQTERVAEMTIRIVNPHCRSLQPPQVCKPLAASESISVSSLLPRSVRRSESAWTIRKDALPGVLHLTIITASSIDHFSAQYR